MQTILEEIRTKGLYLYAHLSDSGRDIPIPADIAQDYLHLGLSLSGERVQWLAQAIIIVKE